MVNFFNKWVELFFFSLMIIGIVTALIAPSAVIGYIIIFISGLMAGRIIYLKKSKFKIGYLMIIIGFLIGFLLGSYYGNKQIIIILFIIGASLSYYLYENNIIKDFAF